MYIAFESGILCFFSPNFIVFRKREQLFQNLPWIAIVEFFSTRRISFQIPDDADAFCGFQIDRILKRNRINEQLQAVGFQLVHIVQSNILFPYFFFFIFSFFLRIFLIFFFLQDLVMYILC